MTTDTTYTTAMLQSLADTMHTKGWRLEVVSRVKEADFHDDGSVQEWHVWLFQLRKIGYWGTFVDAPFVMPVVDDICVAADELGEAIALVLNTIIAERVEDGGYVPPEWS